MLVHWVVCALLLQDDYADKCVSSTVCGSLMTDRETRIWEDLFYCVLYSYLDCRRLVKHGNVPSNFQSPTPSPLYVCTYKKCNLLIMQMWIFL